MVLRRIAASCAWIVALVAFALPGSASAHSYVVNGCGAASLPAQSGWTPSIRTGEPIEAPVFCKTLPGGTDGDIDFTGAATLRPEHPLPIGTTTAAAGRAGGLTFTAPAGTTLSHITYRRRLVSSDPGWAVRLSAGSTVIDDCTSPAQGTDCPDTTNGTVSADLPAGTTSLDLAAICISAPCTYTGSGKYTFGAAIYSSAITIEDDTPPTVSALAATGLSNGWFSGDGTLAFTASDSAGVKSIAIVDGSGTVVGKANASTCVDYQPKACTGAAEDSSGVVHTLFVASQLALTDGATTLHAQVTDAAGNVANGPSLPVNIDTDEPLAVDAHGGGFSSAEQRELDWSLPTGGSPIVSAKVEVCLMDDDTLQSGCQTSDAPLAGPFTFDMPGVNSEAETTIILQDAAGNIGKQEGDYFERDAVAPLQPTITAFGGSGNSRTFVVAPSPTDPSNDAFTVHARLCQGTVCTDQPDTPVQGSTTTIKVTVPGPGDYRLEASLADLAGNVSPPATAQFNVAATLAQTVGVGSSNAKDANGNSGQLIGLTPTFPAKLSGSTILVKGTVKPGSAAQVSVSLAGRLKNRKSTGTSKAVAPSAAGTWAIRLRLPAKLNRTSGVVVTVAATPKPGYTAMVVRKRVKA